MHDAKMDCQSHPNPHPHLVKLILLIALLLPIPAIAGPFVIPEGMSGSDRKRFEFFETFQIKGVCGDRNMDRLATLGVNTVRGYTLEEPQIMREKLDHAHRLGMKMIVGEWMPHHGKNETKEGGS
jgi:hypothetical protein